MKEPQPGTCFAFPTPELAKYSSRHSRCYSRKRHRSSWPFGRGQAGPDAHPQPGLRWSREGEATRRGRCLPVSSAHGFPGIPGDWEDEPRAGGRAPVSSPGSPPSPQPALLTSTAGGGSLETAPPRRTRLLQSQLSLQKTIPELSGNNQSPTFDTGLHHRLG